MSLYGKQMHSAIPTLAPEISHTLMGCSLPRWRNSWCLDSNSFAIWQDLIKICSYTSGWLSPPYQHQPRPQCCWERSLIKSLASLPPLVQGQDISQNARQLLRRFFICSKAGSTSWTCCWAVDGQAVDGQHSIRRCCLMKTEISCGNTLYLF